MSDNLNLDFDEVNEGNNSEKIDYYSEEEYQKRRAVRRARVEAQKKRQLLYRKLFLGGIGVFLVVLIIVIIANVVSCSSKINLSDDADKVSNEENDISDIDDENNGIVDVSTDDDLATKEDDYKAPGDDKYAQYTDRARLFSLNADNYQFESDANTSSITFSGFYSQYGLIVDVDEKTVLASSNGTTKMYPASMTKVMTVLTARQYISPDEMDDLVTVTQEATDYAYVNDCSAVNFNIGEQVTVADLFYGTILQSGADAAYMLAVYVAGSHENFVELMNLNCLDLGIDSTTHFTNCVGIYDDDLYTTCMDMAKIMAASMEDEYLYEVFDSKTYTTSLTEDHPEGITISNWFLRRIVDFDTNGYVAGAKTGFVNQSGNCAVSFMNGDDGKHYISVTGHGSSVWQEIYDHIAMYNIYAMKNTDYREAVKVSN